MRLVDGLGLQQVGLATQKGDVDPFECVLLPRKEAQPVLYVFRCGGRLSDITVDSHSSHSTSADIPLKDAGAWPLTRKCWLSRLAP